MKFFYIYFRVYFFVYILGDKTTVPRVLRFTGFQCYKAFFFLTDNEEKLLMFRLKKYFSLV